MEVTSTTEFRSLDSYQRAKLSLFLLAHCDFTTQMNQTERARVVTTPWYGSILAIVELAVLQMRHPLFE